MDMHERFAMLIAACLDEAVANGQATKIFLPIDTSGVLGSVAAIGEMFKEGWERRPEQPA